MGETAGPARHFPGQVHLSLGPCGHCSGNRPDTDFRFRLLLHAAERRCAQCGRRKMAPRLAGGRNIRTDGQPARGQTTGAARPSGGVTFSQELAGSRLQNGHEIPDTDQCIVLFPFLFRELSFGAFVGEFFDPSLHLSFGT